jgi:hypothetical protein
LLTATASIPSIVQGITIPDVVPYFLAILALLLLWELHAIQVRAGRIQAVDFWNRSGIRMFIHVTPSGGDACPACRAANGKVFLPSLVARKRFSPLSKPCTNRLGCRCLLVGLYGGWPEANSILECVREAGGTWWLSDEDVEEMLQGDWHNAPGATADQVSVTLLQALRDQEKDPEKAIQGFRFILEHAESQRDGVYLIPSYFRLSDLLERCGRPGEALPIVEGFLKTYDKKSAFAASDADLAMMSARRTRLMMMLKTVR